MTDKRSKYDTDPLDPDFVRRTEENLWGAARPEHTEPLAPPSVTEEPTRRFDEQMADSYPSVFAPPAYQPPRAPQPFTTFGAGPHQPPATTSAPPPGPASPYPGPHAQQAGGPTSRPVARLGLPENFAVVLPYIPFYIGLVAGIIELAMVPRQERRVRFHAAQGLALQLAVLAVSFLFKMVALASARPPPSSSSSRPSASGRASPTTSPPSTSPPAGSTRRSRRRSEESRQ
jgi:hypothetical protein